MPCPVCEHPLGHHPHCLIGDRRSRHYADINSLGAIVPLDRLTPQQCEDLAQAAAPHEVTLYYDRDTQQVLRGMYRGMCVWDAEWMEVGHLLKTHSFVRARTVTRTPWWRWWLNTPAVVLTPLYPGGSP